MAGSDDENETPLFKPVHAAPPSSGLPLTFSRCRQRSTRFSSSLSPPPLEVGTTAQPTSGADPSPPVVSAPALHLSAEYLRLFATEALHRAAEVAAKERLEKDGTMGGGAAGPSLLEVSARL